MNKNKPLLSICIPTYNRAKYLDRLLSEIVFPCQSQEINILIFDNGSTDGTLAILKKYQHNNNLKYFCNDRNEGFDLNILKIFKYDASQYIWLMGDDDLLDVRYLKEIIAIILKHPDFGMMYLDSELQEGTPNEFPRMNRSISYELVDQQTYCDQVLHKATLMSSNIINAKYYMPKMINPACLGRKWLHVHIFLKIADKLANIGIKNIIVREKILKQRTGTADEKEFVSLFIDDFLATVSLSKVTNVKLNTFKKQFYFLAIREAILEMGWKIAFVQSLLSFKRLKNEFGMPGYDQIIFILTTCIYRTVGVKRFKKLKKLFILSKILPFLRKILIYGKKHAK
ncbi:hypothetical protein A3J90_06960 [candidate division WOR-1 bacterium RIFOXYC2_FULL_37_10]|uniref:Glycosyltransferase 2-like domain-containing protein n=1 Tax=candidate division WOR-1 bacterium RIFOXYB2_FULL_37_13 TaxID=1802579 RepID=A0A1F4SQH1_UNCSA|nr:MAG: hypothetical protein A2310_07525 [candidate division WOR-1 bacterium RIFOXYB2_FULL_37_13]OGC34223.1 MAG: hypothetical protein A3J90_06960 [candidate division WOR-1 bacterium RIFOXYC2_FULL_37_10]